LRYQVQNWYLEEDWRQDTCGIKMNEDKRINVVLAGHGNTGKTSVFTLSDRSASAYRQLGGKNN